MLHLAKDEVKKKMRNDKPIVRITQRANPQGHSSLAAPMCDQHPLAVIGTKPCRLLVPFPLMIVTQLHRNRFRSPKIAYRSYVLLEELSTSNELASASSWPAGRSTPVVKRRQCKASRYPTAVYWCLADGRCIRYLTLDDEEPSQSNAIYTMLSLSRRAFTASTRAVSRSKRLTTVATLALRRSLGILIPRAGDPVPSCPAPSPLFFSSFGWLRQTAFVAKSRPSSSNRCQTGFVLEGDALTYPPRNRERYPRASRTSLHPRFLLVISSGSS